MTPPRPEGMSESFIEAITARLAEDKPVRRRLPLWGRLHIDRQLPFLCVYRRPPRRDDPGTDRLVVGEAAYLQAAGDRVLGKQLSSLVQAIAMTQAQVFGAFLVIEIWSSADVEDEPTDKAGVLRPAFRIVPSPSERILSTVGALQESLRSANIRKQTPTVETTPSRRIAPPGLAPLLTPQEAEACGAVVLGLEIRPVYRGRTEGTLYPLLLRAVHRPLYGAFKQAFFEFTRSNTSHLPPHYHSLGRRALIKAFWQIDRQLAEVSNAYDFLLAVTPVNIQAAWTAFRRSNFEKAPLFVYRPIPISPALLKRKLFSISIERVEDPGLARIFREKQSELDRQLTGLLDRETKRFLYTSFQLFGEVDDSLLEVATTLLDRIPPHSREKSSRRVGAAAFAQRAEQEFAVFRQAYPEFSAKVSIRSDISGLMVSRGNLLVASDTSIPASRVEALIQHEVGTHVLTYHNGRSQRFRQLYSGLAGYEELQEGMAVMAEHLVGGLSLPRLRLLAARVIAVRNLTDGASFVETFRELDRHYEFNQATAFNITMRIYRGGGLTKDAVYLRGLIGLHKYLRKGGELQPLLVGKISAEDVPVIQELLWRNVLHEAPLRPRYLDDPQAIRRLERVRMSSSILDLVGIEGRS
ncbi:MAG TPA: tyrosine/phenylalanine carboxypeptidase domain-containing protein [Bryobacterales bacterium]|nr:tyrosine/phenylalanine carboxypeptidase domain-containing protein [Bryobacterales bacterium]